MKVSLRRALNFLESDARERVIDETLRTLAFPTPFMVEAGAVALKAAPDYLPAQAKAERVFLAMIFDAQTGG